MPNLLQKYLTDKILSCLNTGFILTFLKKLMLRIWQILLQNWEFYNQFSEGKFFVPNPDRKLYAPQKIFELPQYRLHTDFSKEAYAEKLAKIASELSVLQPI